MSSTTRSSNIEPTTSSSDSLESSTIFHAAGAAQQIIVSGEIILTGASGIATPENPGIIETALKSSLGSVLQLAADMVSIEVLEHLDGPSRRLSSHSRYNVSFKVVLVEHSTGITSGASLQHVLDALKSVRDDPTEFVKEFRTKLADHDVTPPSELSASISDPDVQKMIVCLSRDGKSNCIINDFAEMDHQNCTIIPADCNVKEDDEAMTTSQFPEMGSSTERAQSLDVSKAYKAGWSSSTEHDAGADPEAPDRSGPRTVAISIATFCAMVIMAVLFAATMRLVQQLNRKPEPSIPAGEAENARLKTAESTVKGDPLCEIPSVSIKMQKPISNAGDARIATVDVVPTVHPRCKIVSDEAEDTGIATAIIAVTVDLGCKIPSDCIHAQQSMCEKVDAQMVSADSAATVDSSCQFPSDSIQMQQAPYEKVDARVPVAIADSAVLLDPEDWCLQRECDDFADLPVVIPRPAPKLMPRVKGSDARRSKRDARLIS